jgi:hypothetical protein
MIIYVIRFYVYSGACCVDVKFIVFLFPIVLVKSSIENFLILTINVESSSLVPRGIRLGDEP